MERETELLVEERLKPMPRIQRFWFYLSMLVVIAGFWILIAYGIWGPKVLLLSFWLAFSVLVGYVAGFWVGAAFATRRAREHDALLRLSKQKSFLRDLMN